jgi:hypothetical protein
MATLATTTEPPEPEPPMPPHLRRVLDGLDGLIARAEAAKARWMANGPVVAGDRRATTLAALVDERLALLRASRQEVLADSGRRGGAGRAGGATPVADDTLP